MVKHILHVFPCIMVFLYPILTIDLPEELRSVKNANLTADVEDDAGHCMEEFKNCLNPNTVSQVCAVNALTDAKMTFYSMCEMIHENCRTKKEQWHYLSDNVKNCNGTFGNATILRKIKKL